jgi:hypothetical protein
VTYGGARIGDLIQWESDGVLRLERPLRVRLVTEDDNWVAVEDSETGIPMDQVIVEERASQGRPHFSLQSSVAESDDEKGHGTDLRFKLGKGIVVQIRSKEELGLTELDKLLKLIEAQKIALSDD